MHAEVDHDVGGLWTSLRAASREWLWHRADPARAAVAPGSAFVDAGGLEECVPTVRGLPDHGDAWSRPWHRTGVDCPRLHAHPRAGSDGGAVVVDYELIAEPGYRFVWAAHALLDLSTSARLDALPGTPGLDPVRREWPAGLAALGPEDGTAVGAVLERGQIRVVGGDQRLDLRVECDDQPVSIALWRKPARLAGRRPVPQRRRRTHAGPHLRPHRHHPPGGGRARVRFRALAPDDHRLRAAHENRPGPTSGQHSPMTLTQWNFERLELGEGARWIGGRLIVVDLLAGRVLATPGDVPAVLGTAALPVPVGAVAPVRNSDALIAAFVMGAGLRHGVQRETFAGEGMRVNDVVADPSGRFWVTTTAYETEPETGALHRLGSPLPVLIGLTIPNGLASPRTARSCTWSTAHEEWSTPSRSAATVNWAPAASSCTPRTA